MAITLKAVSIDGADIGRLAQFWADVLDQPVNPGATESFAAITTRDGLRLLFHQVPEGKVVRNRVHLDLATADYQAETDRLIELGGRVQESTRSNRAAVDGGPSLTQKATSSTSSRPPPEPPEGQAAPPGPVSPRIAPADRRAGAARTSSTPAVAACPSWP